MRTAHASTHVHLGDFTVRPRMLAITGLALLVGGAGALAALALLRLIGLVTNLVFYQRLDTSLIAPGAVHHPWWLTLGAPVVGGLIIGVMARFGSEKIRGHGMPEAIEAILTGGSRVQPKVSVLKPVSAAISIGTGGPFGAEGPIIMTGGAIGSILAQLLHLTANERKTLLVSGAAAGMAATFNSPLAAILLAVELLLFEWRPRSFVPVVAAVAVATVCRGYLLGTAPVFPVDATGLHLTPTLDGLAVVVGLTGGALAVAATWLVYRAEDAFARLPFHWMWWPAIGGLIIGLGGLVEPRALGVGYDVIDQLLTGRATLGLIVGILTVKTLIWSLSLGSGTSGGVLAPVFMIGGALGAWEGMLFPHAIPGFWGILGLAAVVGGVMRSPLTGVVFTLELTHAWGMLLPLVVSATAAFALSALVLKRSVLTEKIARRGLHLTREYSTDPLETFFAREVMRPIDDADALTEHDDVTPERVRALAGPDDALLPVTDTVDGTLVGVTTRRRLTGLLSPHAGPRTVREGTIPCELVLHQEQTLRQVAYLFAETGLTSAPVIDPVTRRPIGVVTLRHLLHARLHDLTEEHHRERVLPRPADAERTAAESARGPAAARIRRRTPPRIRRRTPPRTSPARGASVRIYPATIAAQLRTALHNGDATTLAALYHPDVRFAPLDPAGPTASGSAEALAWYRDRRERGFRTVVEELFAYPGSVVLGLRLSHPEPSTDHPTLLYRLFRLGHDQIVEIRDFTDRSRALSAAETPFPWTP